MAQPAHDHDPNQTPQERTYEPPRVEDLGSVAEITQGPDAGTIDFIIGVPGGFT